MEEETASQRKREANPRYALVPASYLLLLREGKVLLQQRQNTGYMDGYWVAGAAGHLEPGETARQAAVREAAEELGVRILPEDLTLLTVMQRTDGTQLPREQRVDWFWVAERWDGEPQVMEPHKAVLAQWWDLDALPTPVPAYERLVLEGLRTRSLPIDTAVGFSLAEPTPAEAAHHLDGGLARAAGAGGSPVQVQEVRRPVPGRPEIVCICGSTRFKAAMLDASHQLALAGAIAVVPGVFSHAEPGTELSAAQKAKLDELHLRKIDLADRVLVVNPGGYFGESTRSEIEYARLAGKPVQFTDPEVPSSQP